MRILKCMNLGDILYEGETTYELVEASILMLVHGTTEPCVVCAFDEHTCRFKLIDLHITCAATLDRGVFVKKLEV